MNENGMIWGGERGEGVQAEIACVKRREEKRREGEREEEGVGQTENASEGFPSLCSSIEKRPSGKGDGIREEMEVG